MAVKYIIASGKGGAGKSSVAAGLSLALCDRGKKVLCIDADVGFKSLDLMFNVGEGTVFSWLDIISGSCTADEAMIKCGEKDLYLLTPPNSMSDLITEESFNLMVSMSQIGFDYVLIDVPAGWNDISHFAASAADKGIIVSTPDAISLRSAACEADKLCDVLKDIRLIVNAIVKDEVYNKNQIALDFCIDTVKARLLGVIPKDESVALLPISGKLSKYVFSAYGRTAARIMGESVPFKSKNI